MKTLTTQDVPVGTKVFVNDQEIQNVVEVIPARHAVVFLRTKENGDYVISPGSDHVVRGERIGRIRLEIPYA